MKRLTDQADDKLMRMDSMSVVLEHFNLPQQHVKALSEDRLVCLVQEEWLRHAVQGGFGLFPKDLDQSQCEQLLAPSLVTLPRPWRRITIKCISKSERLIHSLCEGPLCNLNPKLSFTELMAHISRENYCNIWQEATTKYSHATPRPERKTEEKFTEVIRQWINRLQPLAYHDLDNLNSEDNRPFTGHGDTTEMFNVVPVLALFETSQFFFVLQPYIQHSVQDIVHFSPALFATSHAKVLFVLYQILQTLRRLHERGLRAGDFSLRNLLIDSKLWVYISTPRFNDITRELEKCGTENESEREGSQNTNEDPKSSKVKEAQVSPWDTNSFLSKAASSLADARHFLNQNVYATYRKIDLPTLVDDWVQRRISNFRYLMILNYLAGRRMNDPNNHPVLPWVMDFSHPDGGYRDLSMSKYRINKGDRQLDIMYESMPLLGSSLVEPTLTQTPHHISDVLSDITYYVYKARITPKNILCAHVRTKWVPNEYPSTMQRLQDWTPDECIPEFFTDPTVFTTIHDDLPDLEVPLWCYSPQDFVEKHLAVLESDHVSYRLHQWIDLTFGYQLSSHAAVKSKNVYLHLADQHTNVTNHGVVQLFEQPHPYRTPPPSQHPSVPPKVSPKAQTRRKTVHFDDIEEGACVTLERIMCEVQPATSLLQAPEENSFYTETDFPRTRLSSSSGAELSSLPRPEHSPIRLPHDYDPLAALEHLESLYSFSVRTMQCLPPSSTLQMTGYVKRSNGRQDLVWCDMQALGCMICEMFYAPALRLSNPCGSLLDRYKLICKVYKANPNCLPRPLRCAASVLLQLNKSQSVEGPKDSNTPLFVYEPVNDQGYPPPNATLLLHPCVDVFPFPAHFPDLYECLYAIQQKEFEIEKVRLSNMLIVEKVRWIKVLAREKVTALERFLSKTHMKLSSEELELVLPYVEEMFQNPDTSVQAAWHLFNVIAKALGPKDSKKYFLKYLTTLLSGENSSPKHMKLYHRVYLLQIIIRLGMETFLNNFSTLLVEAVAGYKDFVWGNEQDIADEEIQEDDHQSETENDPSPNSYMDPDPTDSDNDSDLDNNASMITASSQLEISLEPDEDFPDNLSIGGETGDEERANHSQDDSLSESSGPRGSGSSLTPDTSTDTEVFKYGVGSVGKESLHSISRIVGFTRNNTDVTGDSDVDFPESQGDLYSVFDEPSSFNPDSDSLTEIQDRSAVPEEKREGTSVSKSEYYTPESAVDSSASKLRQKSDDLSSLLNTNLVRSETDEFRSAYSNRSTENPHSNICDVASDSVKWLSVRLGPLLTAKYLSRNLIRMLGLCYLGEEQLELLPEPPTGVSSVQSCQLVAGDRNAWKLLDCLGHMAVLYGERVVLSQFFPCIQDMISVSLKRMTVRAEAGLIGAVVLLRHATQYLSDKTLMDILQDTLICDMLLPVIHLASLPSVSFPSGSLPRLILCYKIIDVIYILGLRIGFEMTRKHMTILLQKFFAAFDSVHTQPKPEGDSLSTKELGVAPTLSKVASASSLCASPGSTDDSYLNIKMDSETQEYSIGTPVSVSYLSSAHSPGNTGSWKKQYSLSPAQDDRDEPCETKAANKERIMDELARVFSPELAFTSYIPLCRIFGSIHIEQHLKNDDLIRVLCSQHDQMSSQVSAEATPGSPVTDVKVPPFSSEQQSEEGEIGSNVAMVGNRIQLHGEAEAPVTDIPLNRKLKGSGILGVDPEKLRCTDMDLQTERHLKGNWLAYWEHELGLSERDTLFNFKQIKLQTFRGHTNSIRSVCVMNNENSFISASKDKTVKLWSLRSDGDGSAVSRCQWSYPYHKKSVFSVAFVETMRYMASCDSTVHIWDPFTAMVVSQLDSPKHSPVLALSPLPAPNPHLMTATTEGTLRFLDLRGPKYAHEFRCTSNSSGLIRCVTVSPSSDWVAMGYSTGLLAVLDLRTGLLLGAWKGHDGEILQIKAYNKNSFVTTSFDQSIKLWKVDDGKDVSHFRGPSEPVHCLSFYSHQIITATTANKIGVHSSVDAHHSFTSTRLRSDTFKGVLTCMNILPMNRALLLGADNGTIRLLC